MEGQETTLLSSLDRLREIAGILAASIFRLHGRLALAVDQDDRKFSEGAPNSRPEGLEVPAETVLSVDNGVNGFREPD